MVYCIDSVLSCRDSVKELYIPIACIYSGDDRLSSAFSRLFQSCDWRALVKELVSVFLDPFSVVDCKSTTSHFLRPSSCYFCNIGTEGGASVCIKNWCYSILRIVWCRQGHTC
jgi:hypothetical protein